MYSYLKSLSVSLNYICTPNNVKLAWHPVALLKGCHGTLVEDYSLQE